MAIPIQEVIAGNDLIGRAYEFAKKIHRGERRPNGEPFFNHCLATAEILAGWQLDEAALAAGLLHDVHHVKNKEKILKIVKDEFGEEIAALVAGMAAIARLPYQGVSRKADNLRKFILYLSKDLRVVLIKFAARLDTLQYLYSYPQTKQRQIALKTMEIYAPLAHQLGMYNCAGDLEDLAFPYLYPKDHKWLAENVRERFEERERYLEFFKPLLKKELDANSVEFLSLNSRAKHYYSLYRKLLRYSMDLEKIYDLVAIRLIVRDISDCYTALGVIHKAWPPLPGRIKDYIASPKPNGYRSLHTTVYTPENKVTEIQIRTEEMHREAELGIAAYFGYRNFKGTLGYNERLAVNNNLKELGLIRDLRQFPKKLDEIEFFKNRILVLTPKGDVIDLPQGGTPVDFAYKIHSDVGANCIGAKVNGGIASLKDELRSGDVVEILTQKNKRPSADWLTFVKTAQARDQIKAALNSAAPDPAQNKIRETEILIAVHDGPGLIKTVSETFSRSKIKIKTLLIQPGKADYKTVKIRSALLQQNRLRRITQLLRDLNGVKKITSRKV